MNRTTLCLISCAVGIFSACKKKASPAESAESKYAQSVQANKPVDPLRAAAIAAFERDLAGTDTSVHLRILNEQLNAWMMANNAAPKDLNEFVQKGLLPRLPAPPQGKKFAIDAAAGVILVDR